MQKLFMVIVGCNPPNRFTEQHDVFFGIAPALVELKPNLVEFWPEAGEKSHLDSYRIVQKVGKYKITIVEADAKQNNGLHLYFLNLGGYKPHDMEEYHYKQLIVSPSLAEAIRTGKKDTFWKHHTEPHVDNKYGIDVDDIYLVEDMLPCALKSQFGIQIDEAFEGMEEDTLQIGYLKWSKIK